MAEFTRIACLGEGVEHSADKPLLNPYRQSGLKPGGLNVEPVRALRRGERRRIGD